MTPIALLAQAVALPDTVVMVPAGTGGWRVVIDTLAGMAQILIGVVMVGISAILLGILFALRRLARTARASVGGALQRLEAEARPVLEHARAIGSDARVISTTLRKDFDEFNQTITAANQRLNHAAEAAEERIARFNALLEVMQQEAEDLFIGTASTVRGIRTGTAELRRFRTPARSPSAEESVDGE